MANKAEEVVNGNSYILLHSAIFIFFILFCLLLYYPVIQGHYFFGEDYGRIWTSAWDGVSKQSYVSYTRTLPVEGRPLHTLSLYIIFNKYINSLKSYEAAGTVRFIGVIGVGLLAYILFLIFKENSFRTGHAFLLSILICTLPPFHLYVGRLICVVFVYSVLLSSLSALIMFKTVFKENREKPANIVIAVSAAIILFIMSLCIYQPTATTYWAFAVIPLIMIKDEGFIKRWRLPFTIYFTAGFASMIIYFGMIKIINLLMKIQLQARGAFLHRPVDIYDKLIWFVKYPLYTASNLWNVLRTKDVALFVSVVILVGFLYGVWRVLLQIKAEKKGVNLLFNLLCRYLLILIVIPLSYISSLLVKGLSVGQDLPNHRTLIGPEIIVLLLFYWGLMNISEIFKSVLNFSADLKNKIITVGLVILTAGAAFTANQNVDKYIVKRHSGELKYVRDIIQGYGVSNLSKVSKIYIITFDNVWLKYYSIYHEFGAHSAVGRLGSISLVKMALYELGINSDIPIEYIKLFDEPEKQLPEDKNALFIDMRKLQ